MAEQKVYETFFVSGGYGRFRADAMQVLEDGTVLLQAGEHLRTVACFPPGTAVWEVDAAVEERE